MYIDERKARIFQHTENTYKSVRPLAEAIKKSNKAQVIIKEGQELPPLNAPSLSGSKIIVSAKRSFEAAEQYKDKRVCVLNISSSPNPGGGVRLGTEDQEERLCRCSTLYASLNQRSAWEQFYEPHRKKRYYLNTDDIIYTPGVVVFKSDADLPELRPQNEWFEVNVITCAAPKLRYVESFDYTELEAVLERRIRRIAKAAALYKNEVLILGAFGCGLFKNPPSTVAKAMKKALRGKSYFETVEIAVYSKPGQDADLCSVFAKAFK